MIQKEISDGVSEIEQSLVIQFGATKALELIRQLYKLTSEEREKLKNGIEKNINRENDSRKICNSSVLNKRSLEFANELRKNFQKDCKEFTDIKIMESFKDANEVNNELKLKLEKEIKSYIELLGEKFSYDMPYYFFAAEKPDKNTLNNKFSEKLLPLFEIAFHPETGDKIEFLYPIKGKFEKCYITNAYKIWQFREVHILCKNKNLNTSYRPEVSLSRFLKMIKEGQVRKI